MGKLGAEPVGSVIFTPRWASNMLLSIILVNYKTRDLTLDCIRLLQADLAGWQQAEIIVVDNQSNDGIQAAIEQNFPLVQCIQMGYNAGFARANNAAIRIAKGSVVLLLNNDTIPENGVIRTAFDRLQSSYHPAAGIQLLNADRSLQPCGYYFVKGGLNQLLTLPYTGSLVRWMGRQLKFRQPNISEKTGITEVDWVMGAFLMVKRSAIEKAGLMDEDFFLYAEEAEWCARIRREGTVAFYGDLTMVHFQGISAAAGFQSADKSYNNLFDRKGQQLLLSNLVRIRKQYGIGWYLLMQFLLLAAIPVFALGNLLSMGQKQRPYSWSQFSGFARNVFGLCAFLPKIVRHQPYFYKVL